jgi:benzoyl-CoA reductase subunit C
MRRELRELVERAQRLYEDVEFTVVQEWKKEHPGHKAIGYMPIYVPRELIHAAGMLPVGIMGGGDQIDIIRGDAYFQSYICHIPRSTIELAVTGRLDFLDGMLFPSICDVIRNLSGMWSMLFPERYVRYVDVPQNYDAAVGGTFYMQELDQMRQDFGRIAGKPIDDEALRASIAVYNDNRRCLEDMYRARSDTPWLYPSEELYLVLRAGCVLPPEEHTQLVRDYLRLAAREEDRQEKDHSRIVIRGAFCEQPPLGLLRTLERAGCWIVDDDLVLGMRWLQGDVPLEGDPLEALATAFLQHSTATASRYEPEESAKGQALVQSTRDNRAEGVIFCAPSFCDPALLDQPMLINALEKAGVSHTQFKYSENTGQFAAIREQAGTFSDSIRLWSEV